MIQGPVRTGTRPEIDTPEASGDIFSQGSRFGGHAVYVRQPEPLPARPSHRGNGRQAVSDLCGPGGIGDLTANAIAGLLWMLVSLRATSSDASPDGSPTMSV